MRSFESPDGNNIFRGNLALFLIASKVKVHVVLHCLAQKLAAGPLKSVKLTTTLIAPF